MAFGGTIKKCALAAPGMGFRDGTLKWGSATTLGNELWEFQE
jgi:hypothetical protein